MLDWMSELFSNFADMLMTVLPLSPFTSVLNSMVIPQGVAWLNWFIPVGQMLTVFSAWLTCYGLYLLYSIILRWVKAIA